MLPTGFIHRILSPTLYPLSHPDTPTNHVKCRHCVALLTDDVRRERKKGRKPLLSRLLFSDDLCGFDFEKNKKQKASKHNQAFIPGHAKLQRTAGKQKKGRKKIKKNNNNHLEKIIVAKIGLFKVKAGEDDPDGVSGVCRDHPATQRVVRVVLRVMRGRELAPRAREVASANCQANTVLFVSLLNV